MVGVAVEVGNDTMFKSLEAMTTSGGDFPYDFSAVSMEGTHNSESEVSIHVSLNITRLCTFYELQTFRSAPLPQTCPTLVDRCTFQARLTSL